MPPVTPKRKGRAWRALSPEESLVRYSDWRKCQPGGPKRQADGIIKRQDLGR
jgi:hypothetical protein